MRSLSADIQEVLATLRVTSFALCWQITFTNDTVVRGTEHDRDIEIETGAFAGVYRSQFNIAGSDIKASSDMSVDNMEVEGATEQLFAMSLAVADIESGVLEGASVVMLLVDWTAPSKHAIVRAGYLGGISRDSNDRYRAEVRGLQQKLSQQIGQNYSENCNVVRFGDARCGFDVSTIQVECVVASVANRRNFTATPTASTGVTLPTVLPRGGEVTWSTGDNAGFTREVKEMSLTTEVFSVELYEETAADLEVGDVLTLTPGCDRVASTCRFVYDNFVNFRGHGIFIPGALAIMRGNSLADCVVPILPAPDIDPPVVPPLEPAVTDDLSTDDPLPGEPPLEEPPSGDIVSGSSFDNEPLGETTGFWEAQEFGGTMRNSQNGPGTTPSIVSSQSFRPGGRSIKFQIPTGAASFRSERSWRRFPYEGSAYSGAEHWVGWATRLAPNYPVETSTFWQSHGQVYEQNGPAPLGLSPGIGVRTHESGQYRISKEAAPPTGSWFVGSFLAHRGIWVRHGLYIRWHATAGIIRYYRAVGNTVGSAQLSSGLVLNATNISLIPPGGTKGPYFKFGIYAAGKKTNPERGPFELWHDEMRMAVGSAGSIALVDPLNYL